MPPLQKYGNLSGERRRGRSQTGPPRKEMRVWDGRVRAPAPTKFGGIFRFCRRGRRPRRPAGGHMGPPLRRKTGRERWLGKLRRGSGTAPRANFAHPGPSGPAGIEILTQILRAGRALMRDRRAPVKGARGKAVIGEQSSPLRRPPAAFWLLCRRGQSNPPSADGGIPCKTARRGRRALRPEKGCSLIAPSSVWPSASHLPLSPLSLRDISP